MSEPSPRPRNPWLVILWTFGLFVAAHLILYLHYGLSAQLTGSTFGDLASGSVTTPLTILIQGLIGLFLGIPILLLLVRFAWRRDREWIGLRFELKPFLIGLLLSLAVAVVVVGLAFVLGIARVTGLPARFSLTEIGMLLPGLAAWILFKTLLEEVVFRGMATREFALRWGWPLGTLVSGVYFALCHMVGILPSLTPLMMVGLLIAGVVSNALFVALYRRGRSLSLPWGFHFGWNFALAALVGTTMSGSERSFGLMEVELAGSPWLTGGTFGIETSVIAVLAFAVVAVGAIRYSPRDGKGWLESR